MLKELANKGECDCPCCPCIVSCSIYTYQFLRLHALALYLLPNSWGCTSVLLLPTNSWGCTSVTHKFLRLLMVAYNSIGPPQGWWLEMGPSMQFTLVTFGSRTSELCILLPVLKKLMLLMTSLSFSIWVIIIQWSLDYKTPAFRDHLLY